MPVDSPVIIQNGNFSLKVQKDQNSINLVALAVNNETSEHQFTFGLGFYKTYHANQYNHDSGFTELHSSGHYAFTTTQQDPLPLGVIETVSLVKGEVTNQVVVGFKANGLIEGFGFIKFELDADGTVSTEILLSDLNIISQENGFEVVAKW